MTYGIFPLRFDGPFLSRFAVETFPASDAAERRAKSLYGSEWWDYADVRECEPDEDDELSPGEQAEWEMAVAEREQPVTHADFPSCGDDEIPF